MLADETNIMSRLLNVLVLISDSFRRKNGYDVNTKDVKNCFIRGKDSRTHILIHQPTI